MGDKVRFIGGPEDGETRDVTLRDGRPLESLRLPVVRKLDPVAYVLEHPTLGSEPVDTLGCGPETAEYRLHLDATGHPSRTEDGALRYVYRGQQ